MLAKLLQDCDTLTNSLPILQQLIDAVTADMANPAAIDVSKLASDASALTTAAAAVKDAISAVAADLDQLPQAKLSQGNTQTLHDVIVETIASPGTVGNTRLQNLICLALPLYNMFAATNGWPTIPTPAFCKTT